MPVEKAGVAGRSRVFQRMEVVVDTGFTGCDFKSPWALYKMSVS